jgi:hypothetical protein
VGFTELEDRRLFPCYQNVKAVAGMNHCVCWHERENRLYRYDVANGAFLSPVPFELVERRGHATVTALLLGRREGIIVVGMVTGTLYCLCAGAMDSHILLTTTLVHHQSPVVNIVENERTARMLTYTDNADDPPVVWRIQRLHVTRLFVLETLSVFPDGDREIVHGALESHDSFTYVVSRRRLAVYDAGGILFGAGRLPTPSDDLTCLIDYDDMTCVAAFSTVAWSNGRHAVFSGHRDGSMSLWSVERLPPHEMSHAHIASVKFCNRVSAPNHELGSVTAMRHDGDGVPSFTVGYSSGAVRKLSFEEPSDFSM